MAAVDALTRRLALLTSVVPFYAASVFRAWVGQMNERLVADLAAAREDPDQPGSAGKPQASQWLDTACGHCGTWVKR